VLNKCDVAAAFDFDDDAFDRGVRLVNPDVPILRVSCRTGMGLAAWLERLLASVPAAARGH
jgi:hydrogenase nickel incorporation protein HypB